MNRISDRTRAVWRAALCAAALWHGGCRHDSEEPADVEIPPIDTVFTMNAAGDLSVPPDPNDAPTVRFEFGAVVLACTSGRRCGAPPLPARFECLLSGPAIGTPAWTACSSPHVVDVGNFTAQRLSLAVRSIDTLQRVEATPAVHSWEQREPPPAVRNMSNDVSPLGVNVNAFTGFDTEWAHVDRMKYSSAWQPECGGCAIDDADRDFLWASVDADGWPRRLPGPGDAADYTAVATYVLRGSGGYFPAGVYTVLYDGEGTLAYRDGATLIESFDERPRRQRVAVDPAQGWFTLSVTATDPRGVGEHLRDVRVYMPGGTCRRDPFQHFDEADGPAACAASGDEFLPYWAGAGAVRFHPRYLRDLAPFRVLRFMEVLGTNDSTHAAWADRTRLAEKHWNSLTRGAPVEAALALANVLSADAWLNVPMRADDDYVRRFAELARDRLDPALRVYVEYGNEVWNTAFPLGNWIQQQAEARWPDPAVDGYTKRLNWYGMRSQEVCELWKQAWGAAAGRVRCVIGGQAPNAFIADQALACPLAAAEPERGGRDCRDGMDDIAIAPYFGGYLGGDEAEAVVEQWLAEPDGGLDAVFEELVNGTRLNFPASASGALAQAYRGIEEHAALAGARGLRLVAYEGGQHLAATGQVLFRPIPGGGPGESGNLAIQRLLIDANRDPRMGELYARYLARWRELGGGLFVNYKSTSSYHKYGSWGFKEYQTQDDPARPGDGPLQGVTPKLDALRDFMAANPCWWSDCGR